MSAPDRRALVDRDLALMRRLDELFTAWPFLGSRRMTALLRAEGYPVNRKRVQRLMRQMGIAALGPKPKTTKPAPEPEIFNTDQGSQFTSAVFTGVLAAAEVQISMDGRGRWMDNVFIERLWRSLKYEDIYLKGYADGHEARHGIADWVTFYNHRRPHQALAYQTPMAIWRDGITGALGEGAVDMTLRLDNAGALPTSPQPPQQPKVLVA